jgi:hypothetical protein
MDLKRLLKHLVILMFFLFIMNYLGEKFYWQYSIWFFDMPIHFLGGAWVNMFFIYAFSRTGRKSDLILAGVIFTLAWGVGWEIFEYAVFNKIGSTPFSILDTLSDICFDMAGCLAAFIYYMPITMASRPNKV